MWIRRGEILRGRYNRDKEEGWMASKTVCLQWAHQLWDFSGIWWAIPEHSSQTGRVECRDCWYYEFIKLAWCTFSRKANVTENNAQKGRRHESDILTATKEGKIWNRPKVDSQPFHFTVIFGQVIQHCELHSPLLQNGNNK